jgi:hypothetical protein
MFRLTAAEDTSTPVWSERCDGSAASAHIQEIERCKREGKMSLFGWFGRDKSSELVEDEIKELTKQFHNTLRANFARSQMVDGKSSAETLDRVNELLNPKRAPALRWSEAYEVEQLLVDVYDEQALKTESEVRSIEAAKALDPQLATFYKSQIKDTDPIERRRSVLKRLVNDLQWRYTVNEVKRRYSKDITRRTGVLFTWSLVAFATGMAYIGFKELVFGIPKTWDGTNVELMFLAALAGTWGAAFSMLTSLKDRLQASELDDLKLIQPWVMIFSRSLIGTGAGCVLYFLVRSDLLGGEAFPKSAELLKADFKSLALLVIWSFIAGFSEKLIPGILEKNVSKVLDKSATDPGRYRPDRPEGAPPPTAVDTTGQAKQGQQPKSTTTTGSSTTPTE